MDTTQKHICGLCHDEWLTEAEYIAHVCPATNTTPADPAHLGGDFLEIQKAALERGKERLQATPEADPTQLERQDAAIAEVAQAIAEPVALAEEAKPEPAAPVVDAGPDISATVQ
jgi:hypothetical protein